jgi:hypothetical protein
MKPSFHLSFRNLRSFAVGGLGREAMVLRVLLVVAVSVFVVGCGGRQTASSRGGYTAVRSFDDARPTGNRPQLAVSNAGGAPTVQLLWNRCHHLSKQKVGYSFGSNSPYNGGMDCSGSVQFVLKSLGYRDVPRASYQQHKWMKDMGRLKEVGRWQSEEKAYASMRPGDLVFWGGTYNSGHKVSHVEIYMGRNPQTGQQYFFGARSSRSRGLNGNGVDVFEFPKSRKGRLVGYGSLPGLRR